MRLPAACAALFIGCFFGSACDSWNRMVVKMSTPDSFAPEGDPSVLAPVFDGPDATRPQIPIRLIRIASGYDQPTDIQFVPGRDDLLVVLSKTGKANWENLLTRARGELLRVAVTTASEQGLLGLAFHPQFQANGKLYLYYTTRNNGREISRVSEWHTGLTAKGLAPAQNERILLEVEQPYANHNAGQLLFSAEGYLVIALGDGGFENDPQGNGQNPKTLLGSLLRIDVNRSAGGKPYGIPKTNPFAQKPGGLPEVYAYGLRNPWRASLVPDGRIVVGDVGQEKWEEISVIEAGGNYGWNVLEGSHCLAATPCKREGFTEPIHEYAHGDEGQSVTGGYVYTANRLDQLQGKYVFGDFITGRLWALDIPAQAGEKADTIYTLGKWPILPSTFGRNTYGDVFVADFSSGAVFAIGAPGKAKAQ